MARIADPSWRDGLRSLHPDEFPQLDALLSEVFRPGMPQEYPHIYTPAETANLRVVVEGGEVVAHIGTIRREASIMGCTVRVASLGGVATHPSARGKGYATALFEDAMRDCNEDGVDFIVVSGYRKIYHRYGCRYVGRDWDFVLSGERVRDFADEGLEIRPMGTADVPALAALYRCEPVRWLRPPSDFYNALKGHVMNRPAEVLGIYEHGHLRAYVIQGPRKKDEQAHQALLEFAGDRRSMVGALGALLRRKKATALDVHVMGYDNLLHDMLTERDLQGKQANVSGTVTLVNFLRLMEKLRPHFAEKMGQHEAAGLVFHQRGDQMIFGYGCDRVVAPDRGTAAELIFGAADNRSEEILATGGRAAEALRAVFPIPGLWYGPNYV